MNKVVQSEVETVKDLKRFGRAARGASKILANALTGQKNESLLAMARNDSFFWLVGAFAKIFEAARAACPNLLRSTVVSASDWTTLFIFSIS